MIIGDNRDYIRVLLYSYYATVAGWGVLLRFRVCLLASLLISPIVGTLHGPHITSGFRVRV